MLLELSIQLLRSIDQSSQLHRCFLKVVLQALVVLLAAQVLAMVVVPELQKVNQQLQDLLPVFLVSRWVDYHLEIEIDNRRADLAHVDP